MNLDDPFVCYRCKDGRHKACVGSACLCHCEGPHPLSDSEPPAVEWKIRAEAAEATLARVQAENERLKIDLHAARRLYSEVLKLRRDESAAALSPQPLTPTQVSVSHCRKCGAFLNHGHECATPTQEGDQR